MTEQDREHAHAVIDWFAAESLAKYGRGAAEHGGELPMKGGLLAEAEAECLDHVIYTRTIRDQLTRVLVALEAGRVDEARFSLTLILHGTPADRLTV